MPWVNLRLRMKFVNNDGLEEELLRRFSGLSANYFANIRKIVLFPAILLLKSDK